MKRGFTCGSFDLLHAGHAQMLEECKHVCDYLIVGVQSDPTIDRPHKNKPIQSLAERITMVQAIRWVDEVVTYDTEEALLALLTSLSIDIRIVGADWKGKEYTGKILPIPVYFNSRGHKLSTSELRQRVFMAELAKGPGAAPGPSEAAAGRSLNDDTRRPSLLSRCSFRQTP